MGCDDPGSARELCAGQIVPVFADAKGEKTLALVMRAAGSERYDVMYNDGTEGKNIPIGNFGQPLNCVSSSHVSDERLIAMLRETLAGLNPQELFGVLALLRGAVLEVRERVRTDAAVR